MCVESIDELYVLAHQEEFEEFKKSHPIETAYDEYEEEMF